MLNAQKVNPDNHYYFKQDHRDGTPLKSQWEITEKEEIDVFRNTLNRNWILGPNAWGLYRPSNEIEYLGFGSDHQTRVFIAKFKDGNQNKHWHGYPIENNRNPDDIPDKTILRDWLENGIVPKPKIRKIMRGHPCNL